MVNYQLEKTALWLDVKPIIESKSKHVKFEYRGMLHTELEDIPIMKVVAIDTVRDYAKNIGDYVHIEFSMSLGDYAAKLYPHRANIEFSIKTITLKEVSAEKDQNIDDVIERYKAVFLPNENKTISASDLEQFDQESLNKANIVTIKLQLMDRSLEPLRIKTTSGAFRQVSQKTLLHNLMAGESNKVLVDGKPSIDGVDIVEPDNQQLCKHNIIKDGTLLTEIPSYIQEHMGGVYVSGIGNYLQTYNGKKLWFVYPLFSPKRFDALVSKLIVFAIPEERFPDLDRTYLQDGSVLKILANSTKRYSDKADTELMDKGSGFRMPNAASFMKKPVGTDNQQVTAKRVNLNYETVIRDRPDGLNYAPLSNRISSNPFIEYSKIIARDIARVDIIWDYANPRLLYPGMPCKYVYLVKDKLMELKGNLLFVHSFAALEGSGLAAKLYRVKCQLTLSVERASNVPDMVDTKETVGVF